VNNLDNVKSTVKEKIDVEIVPEAQASSILEPSWESDEDHDIAQISLAVAVLGIYLEQSTE
jgi:hypothetical protein